MTGAAATLRSGSPAQPAPAPRFDRTVPEISNGARAPGEDTVSVLGDYGFSADEIAALAKDGVIPANDG